MSDDCRVCSTELITILDLGERPLANAFLDKPDADEDLYPLTVGRCPRCGTVQLTETVDPGVLFGGDYAYHSSINRPYVEQCHALVDDLTAQLGLGPDDLVGEIGSNDGYLLSRYVEHDVPVLGWEPAPNLAALAEAAGVRTSNSFFMAGSAATVGGRMRIIHANNVLAHAPDINGILAGARVALAPDGVLIVETPNVAPMIDNCLYDTIYHEHLFYWSVTSFNRACRNAGLAVVDVQHLESHGGSLRLWITHQGAFTPRPEVAAALRNERARGIAGHGFYDGFQRRVAGRIDHARAGLVDAHTKGLRIVGYGAAAKGTMLLNALDLPDGILDYVIDATPDKLGRYVPGVHIPVVDPAALEDDQPDAVLILAWNWSTAIIAQHPGYQGQWLAPMPSLHRIETP